MNGAAKGYEYVLQDYREVVVRGGRHVGEIRYFNGTNKYGTPGHANFRDTLDEARAALIAEVEQSAGVRDA